MARQGGTLCTTAHASVYDLVDISPEPILVKDVSVPCPKGKYAPPPKGVKRMLHLSLEGWTESASVSSTCLAPLNHVATPQCPTMIALGLILILFLCLHQCHLCCARWAVCGRESGPGCRVWNTISVCPARPRHVEGNTPTGCRPFVLQC